MLAGFCSVGILVTARHQLAADPGTLLGRAEPRDLAVGTAAPDQTLVRALAQEARDAEKAV